MLDWGKEDERLMTEYESKIILERSLSVGCYIANPIFAYTQPKLF